MADARDKGWEDGAEGKGDGNGDVKGGEDVHETLGPVNASSLHSQFTNVTVTFST